MTAAVRQVEHPDRDEAGFPRRRYIAEAEREYPVFFFWGVGEG